MSFEITEILENFHFIERGYLNANHFVYSGEPPVLIDTGYISDLAETLQAIESIGVDPARTRTIVTTHCHCDHIGGNRAIQERSGCGIILHELGRHFIETRDSWSTWWAYFNQEADFFPCTGAVKDGDAIDIGPHRFEVIHTPGHAADGTVLYNRREKLLLSSDTLWEFDMAVHTVRVEGSGAVFNTRKSLEKISGLDVNTVCPGHGSIFRDYHGALDRSMQRIDRYLSDPRQVGTDLLKKIMVYTVLMKKTVAEDRFFDFLMATHWFKETVALYFEGAYRRKYEEIVEEFLKRNIFQRRNGLLSTTVRP